MGGNGVWCLELSTSFNLGLRWQDQRMDLPDWELPLVSRFARYARIFIPEGEREGEE